MKSPEDAEDQPKLRDHRDCQDLTRLTLERLPRDAPLGRRRHYPKGSLLWALDTVDHLLYFLERGQVTIMLDGFGGCEVIVRVIQPGEPFGELCFCSSREKPRGNCAMASVDSEVTEIDFDDFLSYLNREPIELKAFAFTMCERLADAERRIEILSYRGAEARLGRLLLQLASTRGVSSSTHRGNLRLPVGHDELARMAAMSRPHVSVTMSKLRSLGLLHYDRTSQLTLDLAKLEKYVDGQKIRD